LKVWIASLSLSSGGRSPDPLARNDGHTSAISRRHASGVLQEILAPSKERGRRECRVLGAPAASRANKKRRTRTYKVHRNHTGIPCATVLTAPPWSPRRTGLFSHRRRRDRSRQLDTSVGVPGLHGFAARKRAARLAARFRPSHPAPRSLTVASRPSYRDGTSRALVRIYRN